MGFFPVIPETPHIFDIQFGNDSKHAMLRWNTTEFFENLTARVRLRSGNGSWVCVRDILQPALYALHTHSITCPDLLMLFLESRKHKSLT